MRLVTNSALNLTLKGTTGSFKVGNPQDRKTFEVKYLLTHVGLNFEDGNDESLLKELSPVREIFDFKSLDFDEIMQRDIDDARVSNELIPYILDDSSTDLVKFFPPIVVIVLPIQNDANKPLDYYPSVTNQLDTRENHETGVKDWLIVQSGEKGKEVFRFDQPVLDNVPQLFDLVTLNINTLKSRMIIVDGQHRAMALLALYRNLKEDWSNSRRKPFESYYKEWTPDYIRSFNLKEIKLPMIICTIPELDEKYKKSGGDYDLKKASRSIFLTLNKNARKVSRSRNLLLDDSDLISVFMRNILSKIKNGDRNFLSTSSLEIHNVELDQWGDRQVIVSPMAFTGVAHLHYIVEHLMLDSGDVNGVRKRDGRFSTRAKGTYITNLLSRLDAENTLGNDAYSSISRNVFTLSDERILSKTFIETYGRYILKSLSDFYPFKAFADAAQTIKKQASSSADVHIKPMLFDGQGIARVFEEHRASLGHRLDEGYFKHDVPKLRLFKESLDEINNVYCNMIATFDVELTTKYLGQLPTSFIRDSSNDISLAAVSWVPKLYKGVFQTIAFQAALVCGFFTVYEKASASFDGTINLDLEKEFSLYLSQVSKFFKPETPAQFRNISDLFFGYTEGSNFSDIKISDGSLFTYRSVVFPNEMSPDEWPKYRYLMLEIWSPSDIEFEKVVESERQLCREQVISSLFERNIKDYCKKNLKKATDLDHIERDNIFDTSLNSYKEMLKRLSRSSLLNSSKLKKVVFEAFD